MSSHDYVGWIPNVAGHLSFSHCGVSNTPPAFLTLNEQEGLNRVVFCAQKRTLYDGLIALPYFRFLYKKDPTYIYVLIAESEAFGTDKVGQLTGLVYVLSQRQWRTSPLADDIQINEAIEDKVNDLNQANIGKVDITSIRAGFSEMKNWLDTAATYSSKVIIQRSGMTRLSDLKALRQVRLLNSVHRIEGEGREDFSQETDSSYAYNQVYFFLKDIFHTHKHHDQKADTIIAAHKDDSSYTWLREAHYRLHKKIVSLRRANNVKSFYNALGLMSYVSSLRSIAKNILGEDESEKPEAKNLLEEIQKYNHKEIEDSIKAIIEYRRWRRVQMNILITAAPALLIGLFSVSKSTAASAVDPNLFQAIQTYILGVFTQDWPSFLIFAGIVAMAPYLYGLLDYRYSWVFQTATRIFVAKPQEDHARVYRNIGITLVGIAIVLALLGIEGLHDLPKATYNAKITVVSTVAVLVVWFITLPYQITIPVFIQRVRASTDALEIKFKTAVASRFKAMVGRLFIRSK